MMESETEVFTRPRLRLVTSNTVLPAISTRKQPKDVWFDKLVTRIKALQNLKENWDTYGGERVSFDTISFSVRVLTEIWTPGLTVPDVSPTSNGGIMFEWIGGEKELTIEIERPYEIVAFFDGEDAPEPNEREFKSNFVDLANWVSRFTGAHNGQRVGAA